MIFSLYIILEVLYRLYTKFGIVSLHLSNFHFRLFLCLSVSNFDVVIGEYLAVIGSKMLRIAFEIFNRVILLISFYYPQNGQFYRE